MVKRRIGELSYFNAIACILVVLIHVVSQGVTQLEPTSWQMAALYFPSRLSAFVVPAFLFSGALKMAVSMEGPLTLRGYGKYLLSRLKKIFVPYVVWNVLYFLAFLHIGYAQGGIRELVGHVLLATLSSPFYYVLIVMQFYALLPLWRWLVEKAPFFLAACWAMLITFISSNSASFLGHLGVDFPYADRLCGTYMIFWVAGLYAGRHYDAFTAALKNTRGLQWISGGFILAVAFLAYLQHSRGIWVMDLNGPKLFVDLLSIGLLLRLSMGLEKGPEWLKKGLKFIHRASFFTYLSHCLFLTLGTHYVQVAGIRDIGTLLAIRTVVSYGCPFGLYWLYEKVKKRK